MKTRTNSDAIHRPYHASSRNRRAKTFDSSDEIVSTMGSARKLFDDNALRVDEVGDKTMVDNPLFIGFVVGTECRRRHDRFSCIADEKLPTSQIRGVALRVVLEYCRSIVSRINRDGKQHDIFP